jgi:hypothetical protein
MLDGKVRDDKILAVPVTDIRYAKVESLKDAQEHALKEIAHLFETYKVLEGKITRVFGWSDVGDAKATIANQRLVTALTLDGTSSQGWEASMPQDSPRIWRLEPT